MKWIPSGVLIKVHFAKLGVRGKLPAGRWLYTPNRMQYFRRISAAGKCPDILQDSHWPLVWMISRLNREDKMLYRGSLHIENDLYHLHLLRVIVPQGTQGIRVLLSEDYPLSEPEMLNAKHWWPILIKPNDYHARLVTFIKNDKFEQLHQPSDSIVWKAASKVIVILHLSRYPGLRGSSFRCDTHLLKDYIERYGIFYWKG